MATRIIRPTSPTPQPRRPVGRPETTRVLRATKLQALAEAEHLLREAEEQARLLVEQAEAAAERVREQAAEAGRAETVALLLTARQRATELLAEARRDLTRLAVAIAEKLLGEELRLHPERVTAIVAQCLRHAGAARRLTIKINPGDQAVVEKALPQLKALTEAELLQVEPSPAVGSGGCLIETELGQMDGRLATQLQALLEGLEARR